MGIPLAVAAALYAFLGCTIRTELPAPQPHPTVRAMVGVTRRRLVRLTGCLLIDSHEDGRWCCHPQKGEPSTLMLTIGSGPSQLQQ